MNGIADIFTLADHKDEISNLPRWGSKMVSNVLRGIAVAKQNFANNNNLERVLYGLGIPQVGEETAQKLASYFGSIDALRENANQTFFSTSPIPDIGVVVSRSIIEWFSEEQNVKLIEQLKQLGINFNARNKSAGSENNLSNVLVHDELKQKVFGKKVVITGNFDNFDRTHLKEILVQHGAKVNTSISKKTNVLFVGGMTKQENTSKLEFAIQNNIEIVNENQLIQWTGKKK